MLALIAGTGDLPKAVIGALDTQPLVCALDGFAPDVPIDLTFRVEHLGTLFVQLRDRGITRVCMAGAVRRPQIDPSLIDALTMPLVPKVQAASLIDALTMPLVPKVQAAMAKGDDGALRVIIALFEDEGFEVVAAHQIATHLLPRSGVLTHAQPADWHKADAVAGEVAVAQMGASDQGQACIVRMGRIEATEDQNGTEAMMKQFHEPYDQSANPGDPLALIVDTASDLVGQAADWLSGEGGPDDPVTADDGILFKAPKPNQDRRADFPLIGPATAMQAAEAGLAGIVVEAAGVMVLDQLAVIETLDAQGMFLWVRPKGDT